MQQFSIKNDHAVELLNDLTKRTGKGKTELVIEALESYRRSLGEDKELDSLIEFTKRRIHTMFPPSSLGKAPSKEEIEEMLGMP